MRIVHIIPYYKPAFVYGGPVYSCSALCESLIKKSHQVTVLTTTANGENELTCLREVIEMVEILRFKRYTKNNTFLSPGLAIYLFKNIKKYDVVHIHTWWNLVSIFSLIICSIHGIRPVLSSRGMLSRYIIETNNPKQKRLINWIFNNKLSKVKFHATAHTEVEEIKTIFPDADITEISNFINIPPPGQKPDNTLNDKIKLIFLSRIDPKKGLELLLVALAGINWQYHLNIVGPSDKEYLDKLKLVVSQLGIKDNITWMGPIFGKDKFELLANHDLLVLPSYNENFANIVIESLAMGTPVLISNKVGLFSYIEKNNLGWVCTTNAIDIRDKLNLFMTEKAKRRKIMTDAPGLIAEDFNHDHLVNEYVKLYLKP